MSSASLIAAQEQFTAHLPAVENAVRWAFRRRFRLGSPEYDDAVAETFAACWRAWVGLLSRGKDPVEIGVHGIAHNAIRYVRNGRKVANRTVGRSAMDVHHRKAQAVCGFKIEGLDGHGRLAGETAGEWRDWIASGKHSTPADQAAFRLDFAAWLASLPERRRRTAERLCEGFGTLEVAKELGITAAAVSQARTWLARSWGNFQGESPAESN